MHPNDLWTTICSLPEATLRDTLFHASTGSMTHPQMLFSIYDMHHQRIRSEAEAAAAARKAEDARIKREKKRVVSFDRDVEQVEEWLHDDHPNNFNRRSFAAASALYEKRLKPRIAKMKEWGMSEHASFGTRCNALKGLIGLAEVICERRKGAIGCEIVAWFGNDDLISEAMLAVLGVMSPKEIERACSERVDGMPLFQKVYRVSDVAEESYARDGAFECLEKVVNKMGYELQVEDDIVLWSAAEQNGKETLRGSSQQDAVEVIDLVDEDDLDDPLPSSRNPSNWKPVDS